MSDMILNRFFTKKMLDEVINEKNSEIYSHVAKKYVPNYKQKTNLEVIERVYEYMAWKYRNEYFYQNTILNKILLGHHSPNTTTAITQLPVDKSIADFILINGKATVYEIKTDLDNFDRLMSQLSDYYKAFNIVYVVTSEENFVALSKMLEGTSVGIRVIMENKAHSISQKIYKVAQPCNDYLDHESIFKILRKSEFENILLSTFNKLPETYPVFYYKECLKMFAKIPIHDAHKKMIAELKMRNTVKQDPFKSIPYELKSLVYFYSPSLCEYDSINSFLSGTLGGD